MPLKEKKANSDINFWNSSIEEYYNRDYSAKENTKVSGKYYKIGFMGHRQVVEYGDIRLKYGIADNYYPNTAVGSVSKFSFEGVVESYEIKNHAASNQKVKLGIQDIVKATACLEDETKTGSSTVKAKKYDDFYPLDFYSGKLNVYEIENINTYTDLTEIPDGKKAFALSKVSCYLEFDIKKSYTIEQRLSGWKVLKNTIVENYTCRYYITDRITFCYNDDTFGYKSSGVYNLGVVKEY